MHFWMLTNKLAMYISVCCVDVFMWPFAHLSHLEMGSFHPVLSKVTEMGHGAKINLTFGDWVSVIRRDVNSMRFSDSFFTFVTVAKLQK